jgi:hypothetical protein
VTDEGEAPQFNEAVRRLPGVVLRSPAPVREIERVEAFAKIALPPSHRALLLRSNGVTANWGYLRLFGVGDDPEYIGPWNMPEMWKFAWPEPLDDFLAIAGTGWGDQYAYRLSDLRRGVQAIHRLDRHLMEPADVSVADDFDMFLRSFFVGAREPGEDVEDARRQIGDLRSDELAIFSPSPLLVGIERATHLMKMFARGAMIANGDMKRQLLDPANETREVARIENYQDELGRPRIRVHWA